MREKREYYRVRVFARVGTRVLAPKKVEEVKHHIRSRHLPIGFTPSVVNDSRLTTENRVVLDLLRNIATSLERIERHLEGSAGATGERGSSSRMTYQSTEITLSGSGLFGAFELDLQPDDLVELELELLDTGIPMIPALARVVGPSNEGGCPGTAFKFEEIHQDNREHIVQLTLRRQSEALREQKAGEGR